jgi:hypothetical protein
MCQNVELLNVGLKVPPEEPRRVEEDESCQPAPHPPVMPDHFGSGLRVMELKDAFREALIHDVG